MQCGDELAVKAMHQDVLVAFQCLYCEHEKGHDGQHGRSWGDQLLEW